MYVAVISEKGSPFLLKLTIQKPLKKKKTLKFNHIKIKTFGIRNKVSQQKTREKSAHLYHRQRANLFYESPQISKKIIS